MSERAGQRQHSLPQESARTLILVNRENGIGIVEIDNPPVNALGHAVRLGLLDAIQQLDNDPQICGIVIACRGKTFFSGADIAEFAHAPQTPSLSELIAILDAAETPTAAAMKGTVLGAGLEFALACRLRVLDASAVVGLPETRLGLIPGAGGTVRLPRLVGPDYALQVIVSGSSIPAAEAKERGIVHDLASGDVLRVTLDRLRALLDRGEVPQRVREMPMQLEQAFAGRAVELERGSPENEAKAAAIEAIRNAGELPFDNALREERRLFERLRSSHQSRARRHLFFAERRSGSLPDLNLTAITPRDITRAGVVGAGVIGSGIALSFALAGLPVVLREISRGALAVGLARVAAGFRSAIRRGLVTPDEGERRQALISGTLDLGELAACDLVVEAAFEDIDVKRRLFIDLDGILRPGAILATNTSYLDVDELAAATARPADVAGMHFFSPAHVMPLVEIVRGRRTAPDVLATLRSVSRQIGKIPAFVGVCRGFVGNRMLASRNAQIPSLLLEGALPQDVDGAFREFGWPMGPLQMWDMAGLDTAWRNRKFLGTTEAIGDSLCALGRFGQKTGRGYYIYAEGSREPIPDDDVAAMIERASRDAGISRRAVSNDEIIGRTHAPMINEACRILDERIAARASDIDVIWANGYGFPRQLGGPMYWAEQLGWRQVVNDLTHWHGVTGSDLFRPTDRLVAMSYTQAGV